MNDFNIGDRVILKGHPEFADGITGTVAQVHEAIRNLCPPDEWADSKRTYSTKKGEFTSHYIEFDEPHDDGSGDGPYKAAEILIEYLLPLNN